MMKGIRPGRIRRENLRWKEDEGELVYLHQGQEIPLDVNPFTTLSGQVRSTVGVFGMLSGRIDPAKVGGLTIGDPSRVLDVQRGATKALGQISAKEFHDLYGKARRARDHFRFTRGAAPTPSELETFDNKLYYFEEGELPSLSPIFSERYDFVRLRLHGGLSDQDLRGLGEKLRLAGLSKDQIGRMIGGEHFIKNTLLAQAGDDPVEARRIEAILRQIRSGSDAVPRSILMETLTGVNRPRPSFQESPSGRRYGKVSIGPFAEFAESMKAVAQVETAVERIAALGSSGTVTDEFTSLVERMAKNANPELTGARLKGVVGRASEDLALYVKGQRARYGRSVYEWQGFGATEGFLAREAAQGTVEGMREARLAYEREMPSALQEMFGDAFEGADLKAAAEAEYRMARQELSRPGSTSGVLTINARQPDFTMLAGYEFGRMTILGSDAMRALGMDPAQVHMMSSPLSMWSRREDYDYDLNFMATVDDPAVAHMLRVTKAQAGAEQMATLFHVLNKGTSPIREGQMTKTARHEAMNRFMVREETFKGPGGEAHTVRRVTTPLIETDQFMEDPVEALFGFRGPALGEMMGTGAARENPIRPVRR